MHTDTIIGTVQKIIFQNEESGYTVFTMESKKAIVTVQSQSGSIRPGQEITAQGEWVMHQKFGKQFHASSCSSQLPATTAGLKRYLSSGLIKGIGPSYAEKLVDHFGMQTLTIIDTKPELLHTVSGIGPKRVEAILNGWQEQKAISHIMLFLQEKEISVSYALKIYKKYGDSSIALLQENPYRLAEDIWGIGFKIADQIAQKIGIEPFSRSRIRAGITHQLMTNAGVGDLYAPVDDLKEQVAELLGLALPDDNDHIKYALHDLYEEEKIKLISFADQHFIALKSHYFSEMGVAKRLLHLIDYPAQKQYAIDRIYTQLRDEQVSAKQPLTDEQQQGIITALQSKITIITGGPGTGKTTMIKRLLAILDQEKTSYKLAAPTGRAAKRMSESTGRYALTIHRLLEFEVGSMSFAFNESRALALDFLIVDEASMLDIFLAHALLKALPYHARLILIGDIDQLPSVGAGNFLQDCMASAAIPVICLKTIFRQAATSMIIVNAHRVNEGQMPIASSSDCLNDFIFIKENDPQNISAHLRQIFSRRLGQFGIAADQATVLVPMNRGGVGAQKLNHDLQQLLNPGTSDKQIVHAATTFKVGDRVMQLRNNYDKAVFNGDIGSIIDIAPADKQMVVAFDGRELLYEANELDELVLSYAITIHKSQGSEYDAAIIPLFMQHFILLQKNLLYTAITRAKKLCIIIGEPKAIALAVKNSRTTKRITFLEHYLTKTITCR